MQWSDKIGFEEDKKSRTNAGAFFIFLPFQMSSGTLLEYDFLISFLHHEDGRQD